MIVKKNIQFLLKYYPALISGLFLTLSFPNTNIAWLAFFALIPLLVSIQSMTPQESFYAGFITGISFFLTLIYWIVPTIHVYGGLHLILAFGVLTLLCLYLALYPAIFAFTLKKLRYGLYTPLLAACIWTGLEYIRTYAFTGFSWGTLGYSQYENLALIQIADFTGVYGVSFLIILVNSSLAVLCINFKKNKIAGQYIIPVIYTTVLVTGAYIYGSQKINNIDSQIKKAKKTTISIIQGNIKQNLKWSDEFKIHTIEKYIQLSKSQIKKNPDLVIWPETALPFYYGLDQVLSNHVAKCIKSSKTNFLIGSPAFKLDKEDTRFYNRAYMFDEFADITRTYDKSHLVPFGEYVPFGDYLTFLGKITAQAGNFSAGDQAFLPLEFNNHNLKVTRRTGVLICFEILFPSISSKFVKNGADILTTITNDAWFGQSSAAMQHFSIAVFRAVENRRTLARAANTGVSGFIDPKGKIIKTTSLFKDTAVTRQVPILNSLSFYTTHGDVFAIGSILVTLAFLAWIFIIRKFT